MKWHQVINLEAEYEDHKYQYNYDLGKMEYVAFKRVGVEIPSHAGVRYLHKDEDTSHWSHKKLELAETINVMRNNVCAYCRRNALKAAGKETAVIA